MIKNKFPSTGITSKIGRLVPKPPITTDSFKPSRQSLVQIKEN